MIDRKDKRLKKNKKREIEKKYSYIYIEALNKGFREVAEELKLAGYDIIFIDTDNKSIDMVTSEALKRIGQIWN